MYYFDEVCISVCRFACVCLSLCICVRNEKEKIVRGKPGMLFSHFLIEFLVWGGLYSRGGDWAVFGCFEL